MRRILISTVIIITVTSQFTDVLTSTWILMINGQILRLMSWHYKTNAISTKPVGISQGQLILVAAFVFLHTITSRLRLNTRFTLICCNDFRRLIFCIFIHRFAGITTWWIIHNRLRLSITWTFSRRMLTRAVDRDRVSGRRRQHAHSVLTQSSQIALPLKIFIALQNTQVNRQSFNKKTKSIKHNKVTCLGLLYILEYLIVRLVRFVLLLLLFNFVMHCIISTVVVAFEINYLFISLLNTTRKHRSFQPQLEIQNPFLSKTFVINVQHEITRSL